MHWCDVDGLRLYLSNGETRRKKNGNEEPRVSRKSVYLMVAAGMRTAPRGDSGKRFWYCTEWADEFLVDQANAKPVTGDESAPPIAMTPSRRRA